MPRNRWLPKASVLQKAHSIYIDNLFRSDGWGCTLWKPYSAQMLFWYGVSGSSYAGGWKLADKYLDDIAGKRKFIGIPRAKLKLWKTATALVDDIRRKTGMELVPWLAQTRIDSAWERLQTVHLVGPKIASWFLRDISFLMDYCIDGTPTRFRYGNRRNARWFESLDASMKRLFIPVDIWVFEGAKETGALSTRSRRLRVQGIQSSRTNHLRAAEEIVKFAERKQFDPRDLNAYWYMFGSGWIDEHGQEQ